MKPMPLAVVQLSLCVWALSGASAQAQDRFSLSGFGSLVAGKVTSGDGYIASYPTLGIYGKHGGANFGPDQRSWFNPETRLGLQAGLRLADTTRLTGQVMARGADKYKPKAEWFYLTHEFSPELDLQAGQMRLPVYMYSDKMDVGFAYPWLRVPSDAYSLDSVNYTGARLNYRLNLGDISARLSLWGGKDKDLNSRLMSYLFSTQIDRRHSFSGVVGDVSWGDLQLRATYTRDSMKQSTPNPAQAFRNENFKGEFYDLALSYQAGDFTLLAEWNKDRPFYSSWYLSGVYQFGVNSAYLTYSRFILDLPWEKHNQVAIGWRRDIGSNMALKFDVTRLRDQGRNPFSGAANPVIKLGAGHATVASVALDFIF